MQLRPTCLVSALDFFCREDGPYRCWHRCSKAPTMRATTCRQHFLLWPHRRVQQLKARLLAGQAASLYNGMFPRKLHRQSSQPASFSRHRAANKLSAGGTSGLSRACAAGSLSQPALC